MPLPLNGRTALVTAGPTIEPIDPVRFISNHSSGRQGVAIAEALLRAGADVTLVAGPLKIDVPPGITHIKVQTADDMLQASLGVLPADIAVCTAAVADYKVANASRQKIKKSGNSFMLQLAENADILATIAKHETLRPRLVIGFAAETENLLDNARAKLQRKQCDAIVANLVGESAAADTGFDSLSNEVAWVTLQQQESWPRMTKENIADKIVQKIRHFFED